MASTSKKAGLSNGLMSLKFMQRGPAIQAEKKAEQAPAKPAVVQDGKWEIAREVRESLGLESDPLQNVTYEESYLPFLTPEFASTSSLPASGGGGRRSFGRFNKALEPKPEHEEQTADMLAEPEPADSTYNDSLPASRKLVVKPAALATGEGARKTPRPSQRGEDEPTHPNPHPHSNARGGRQQGISEGAARRPEQQGFRKPRGVDMPSASEGQRGGKKRRQEEGEGAMESRRAKKQKKQKKKAEE
ncbi:hypothetical protein CALCODRAFT_481591 [Calocera cornea HHB12733]|uniref:Uncharacterized protein n=1 Tax=Calocera cornea HHB12733 TaxID=1353952 RepID=A0A165HIJ6_9BASI|nr:hypothetical protein CALCODRAFT_481591 [Calocera cornea HHB12733]